MEDYVFEDLEAKNLIQDILCQQLNTAVETLWCGGCFSGYGIGPIYRIIDTITTTVYRDLLSTVMLDMLNAKCRYHGHSNTITILSIRRDW